MQLKSLALIWTTTQSASSAIKLKLSCGLPPLSRKETSESWKPGQVRTRRRTASCSVIMWLLVPPLSAVPALWRLGRLIFTLGFTDASPPASTPPHADADPGCHHNASDGDKKSRWNQANSDPVQCLSAPAVWTSGTGLRRRSTPHLRTFENDNAPAAERSGRLLRIGRFPKF